MLEHKDSSSDLSPILLEKNKPQYSAPGCTTSSPFSADMNPRGTRCTTTSSAFSIFEKINEQASALQKTPLLPLLLSK